MTNSTLNTATFSAAPSAGGTPVTGTVSVSGNTASLTPSVHLAQNTSYTATISTAAKDAAGNALTVALTWNFTTADTPKVWGTAQLLDSDNAGNAFHPQFAFDANGNAIAVWDQSDGAPGMSSRVNIWVSRFSAASGSWGTAQLIETGDAGSAWQPQIALDSSGNAIAVWWQFDGTRSDIWANRFSAASGTWGTAQLLETDNAGNAHAPEIAFDASGNAIAVWYQSDGTRHNIWAKRFSAASDTWGTAQMIETSDSSAASPQIAFDASGNAIAVWGAFDIWANHFSAATGTWGTAQVIGNSVDIAINPRIALDASGNAIAVWQQSDRGRSEISIWANRFSAASGTWDTAQLIETENAGRAIFPQIALDASGNAIAVWYQFDGTRSDIWANRFSAATGTWGTAQLIETGNGNASGPQVAFDPSGNAMAVWHQYSETGIPSYAWFNRFSAATGTWGTAQFLETGGGAQIAFDTSGNAIAVMPGSGGIWANRFQ